MNHTKILLDKYFFEPTLLHSFYGYTKTAFEDTNVQDKLFKKEADIITKTVQDLYNDSGKESAELNEFLNKELPKAMPATISNNIKTGLSVLRRQLLEAAYSIFEHFLCHVVRVFIYSFPEILKDIERTVHYRDVVDNKESIFSYIIEKEINRFSYLSLTEKKDYLTKKLKLKDDFWIYEGREMWKDIDKKRQDIVHKEEVPEISEDYLLLALTYFQRIMLGIASTSQVEHGIPFVLGNRQSSTKTKRPPSL